MTAAIIGTIYLLHFDQPYKHARHYIGWSDNLTNRLASDQRGGGANLIAVIRHAGIGFTLARTCTGARGKERTIKRAGGATHYCPLCGTHPRIGRWT